MPLFFLANSLPVPYLTSSIVLIPDVCHEGKTLWGFPAHLRSFTQAQSYSFEGPGEKRVNEVQAVSSMCPHLSYVMLTTCDIAFSFDWYPFKKWNL